MPTLANHDAVADPGVLGRGAEVVALEAELKAIHRRQQRLLARIDGLPEGKLASVIAEAQVLTARTRDVQNQLLGADVLARLERLEVRG